MRFHIHFHHHHHHHHHLSLFFARVLLQLFYIGLSRQWATVPTQFTSALSSLSSATFFSASRVVSSPAGKFRSFPSLLVTGTSLGVSSHATVLSSTFGHHLVFVIVHSNINLLCTRQLFRSRSFPSSSSISVGFPLFLSTPVSPFSPTPIRRVPRRHPRATRRFLSSCRLRLLNIARVLELIESFSSTQRKNTSRFALCPDLFRSRGVTFFRSKPGWFSRRILQARPAVTPWDLRPQPLSRVPLVSCRSSIPHLISRLSQPQSRLVSCFSAPLLAPALFATAFLVLVAVSSLVCVAACVHQSSSTFFQCLSRSLLESHCGGPRRFYLRAHSRLASARLLPQLSHRPLQFHLMLFQRGTNFFEYAFPVWRSSHHALYTRPNVLATQLPMWNTLTATKCLSLSLPRSHPCSSLFSSQSVCKPLSSPTSFLCTCSKNLSRYCWPTPPIRLIALPSMDFARS